MENPTLIMIHGLVGSLHYFDPPARMPGISVITEDLLGYGRQSDVPPNRLTLAAHAELVTQWIDAVADEGVWLLGHSMGGAVAVLAADLRPQRVRAIINVEGNFTEKDTFWSRRIAAQKPAEWADQYHSMQDDPAAWLERCGIDPDPQRAMWAKRILANQPAGTVYAMAQALLAETLCPEYLRIVQGLLDRGLPLHLLAGAKSTADWGVPDFVRDAAASYTEQPDVGHLMMLEAPDAFCQIVTSLLAREV
jgi:pimeloyl-ACP methyl ester carboxylesterase